MVRAAGEAEGRLSGAVASFGWKWATVAAGAAAGGIVAVLLAGWRSVWWEHHQVEQLAKQRAALAEEVGQLQAQAEDWAKRGGWAKLEKCGDQGCLCVRVDKTVGFGKNGDYFVSDRKAGNPIQIKELRVKSVREDSDFNDAS